MPIFFNKLKNIYRISLTSEMNPIFMASQKISKYANCFAFVKTGTVLSRNGKYILV